MTDRPVPVKHNRYSAWSDSDTFVGWLFVAPFLMIWGFWFFRPFMLSLSRSFQDVNFMDLNAARFIWFGNYLDILRDPEFHEAVLHSLTIVVFAVPTQSLLALLVAIALNRKLPGRGVFRKIYSVPYIVSPIAVATVFMVLFRRNQVIVRLLSTIIQTPNVTWFADVNLALPFVILMFIWQQTGFFMIIYIAGLQGIPDDLYEAATVDGANPFQKFRYITVPSLKPVTYFVVTVGTILAFQIFDQIAAISRYGNLGSPAGATTTVITYFYQHGIRYMNIGRGSAAVVIFVLIIMAITALQKRLMAVKE